MAHSFVTEANAVGHVLTVRQQLDWQLIDVDPSLVPGAWCLVPGAWCLVPAACVELARLVPQFQPKVRRLEFLFEELGCETNADFLGGRGLLWIA